VSRRRGEVPHCAGHDGLARKHPTQHHDELARKHPNHEVWAFGSRVTGSAKEFSDLDLVVIGEKPLSLAVHANLVDDFSESDLPYNVDVIDWATTDAAFRQIIQRSSVVVQHAVNRRQP
jgi:type I restriction enzyme S subunit